MLFLLACTAPSDTDKPAADDTALDGDADTDTDSDTDTDADTDSDTDTDTDTAPTHGMDLVFVDITTDPAGAGQHEVVTFTITARNDGDTATPAVTSAVYYSDNPRVTASDWYVCDFTLDALDPGQESTTDVTCEVPVMLVGEYSAAAWLDSDDALEELDETNNSGVGDDDTVVEVGDWPDMTFGYIYADDYDLRSGGGTEVHFNVENHGTVDTSTYILYEFYLSEDEEITRDDYLLASGYVNYICEAGGEILYYGSITMPEVDVTTTYHLGAIMDPEDDLEELDETNNVYLVADDVFTVTADPTYDVQVLSVSTGEYAREEAETVSYTVEIANNGNVDTPTFSLALVYSADTTIDTSDTRICTVSVTTPIASHGTDTLTGTCEAPAGLDGAYWFGAIADSAGSLSETDETNNAGYDATGTVAVSEAHWDLAPSNVDAGDYTVDWEDLVAFQFDVTNNGTSARSGFDVDLYYSTDTNVTTADDLICTYTVSGTLAAGATDTYTADCVVPPLLQGDYVFGVIVDPDGDVHEDDETNNTAYDATLVAHDGVNRDMEANLVYESNSTLNSGDTDTYYFEVINLGEDDVDDFTIELYYSTDATITTGDTLICSFAGESISGLAWNHYSSSCTVPSVRSAAYYYLGMLVDPDREVDETDETNNSAFDVSPVAIYP